MTVLAASFRPSSLENLALVSFEKFLDGNELFNLFKEQLLLIRYFILQVINHLLFILLYATNVS